MINQSLPKILPSTFFKITMETPNGRILATILGKGANELHANWIDIHIVKFIHFPNIEALFYIQIPTRH